MVKLECPSQSDGTCKTLSVRPVGDQEKDKVMNLLEMGFPQVYEREKEYWRDIIDIDPTLIMEMNDELVCVSSVRRPQLIRNRSVSWIDLITCHPNARRMGLGTEILSQSEKMMKEMGAKKGRLWTEVDNTPAVSFYSKQGWKVLERTEWGYQHGHRLTMEKIL